MKHTDNLLRIKIIQKVSMGLAEFFMKAGGEARNIEKGLQSLRAAAKRGSKEAQEYLKRIGQ